MGSSGDISLVAVKTFFIEEYTVGKDWFIAGIVVLVDNIFQGKCHGGVEKTENDYSESHSKKAHRKTVLIDNPQTNQR